LAVYIPWDIESYFEIYVQGHRDQKRKIFPNPKFGKFSEPLTVVDSKGRIVLWYLPGLLSSEQQVGLPFLNFGIPNVFKIVCRESGNH
jgi:hypothetical protein